MRDLGNIDISFGRLFEDPFGIVMVTVWDTWDALKNEWPKSQGYLVEVISKYIPRSDAKAWDGYLVLLLPSESGDSSESEVDQIRQDTSRVRKLVAVGRDLQHLGDLKRALAPLLPLSPEELDAQTADPLKALPDLISGEDSLREAAAVLVDAFVDGRSLVEKLHQHLWASDED